MSQPKSPQKNPSKGDVRSATQIRRDFLDFFAQRGHREVPSSPVFPQDDPTLLFTNAGMNQFKDVFLGTGKRDYTRAVDSQKCIRVSGKHNDLEEVGHDTYHHTFFEMLGNWSFGDYFKAEAIPWAWELLTKTWKLPKERLWVTVFGGDEKDGLPRDEDSGRIWKETTDVDPSHVLFFGRKANFWEMGETGPCGPCTEIHIDRGGLDTDPRDGANPKIGVNAGSERFLELWNNVFMEFNRLDDGRLVKLPAQHVDTGMGFERIVGVLQGKRSNYDTDVFAPIFARIGKLAGKRYGSGDEKADIAFRVIADHVRACTVAFADGALPSNTGRGYVLRRLIRRASRYGRQALGFEDPFLCEVAPAVAETLGEVFPEIPQRMEHVQLLLRAEEESFNKTLGRGLVRFGELATRVEKSGKKALDGGEAYELYATYGFPRDLVELMARERKLAVDDKGWDAAEGAHRTKSKSEGKFKSGFSEATLEAMRGLPATTSTYWEPGVRSYEVETVIIDVYTSAFEGEAETSVSVILRESPFYPESGGQVSDRGVIEALDGSISFQVEGLARSGEHLLHRGKVKLEDLDALTTLKGLSVRARVDRKARDRTRKNHTATHLLHKALKLVLGEHVAQQGSYVGPDRLRFDFSHPKAVTPEALERIERIVNERVIDNARVDHPEKSFAEAKASGAVAMFGEKYGDRVKVLDVGGWSLELCGGTHVAAAGDIGPFVILSEGAIQAGVRRIEALTGAAAVEHIQHQKKLLREAARALKASVEELPQRIEQLQQQLKDAKKKEKESAKGDVAGALEAVRKALRPIDGLQVGIAALELELESLRELAGRVKTLAPDLAVILLGQDGDKAPWVALSQGAALTRGWEARHAAAFLAPHLGGGGGGKPDLAQGQGQRAAGRAAALEAFQRAPKAAFSKA
ncbi:MAG: alanine--tRNA ligase [Planctomycetes bacterium]|nr:alanine--tRNA ligase [Planctomycetota bacterium]